MTMLAAKSLSFPLEPRLYAPGPIPSVADWKRLWTAWDLVTRGMIPPQELHSKPINLRNCCLFYLGHIPTFLDIHLTRATGEKPTEPGYYPQIFERGIDPDVENPELCHSHSEIPDEWPPLEEVLKFQQDVRDRTEALYENGVAAKDRKVARALWLGFEHEAMHLETLLYMLLQSDKTIPPATKPDFEAIAREAHSRAKPRRWVTVPEQDIRIGIDDPETDDGPERYFGWDVERPSRKTTVHAFEAQTHALTNGDYARYLNEAKISKYPVSWIVEGSGGRTTGADTELLNGYTVDEDFLKGKSVRTTFGPVPLKFALDWPVMASYDELAGCANWFGGRIPTADEARSIYEYVEQSDSPLYGNVCPRTIPAVNGHLSNEGVQETPPESQSTSLPEPSISLEPTSLFADLRECNVGFKAFHPLPVTTSDKLAGQGNMGGVWEWTSSVLEPHSGFKAMDLYPGYSSDFFDGKHNVVLGGSWATHPRIAGRKSFVNWYQRNYPYAWCGARMVRDIRN